MKPLESDKKHHKRSPTQRKRDRALISKMYLQGKTQYQIKDYLDARVDDPNEEDVDYQISRQQIWKDLDIIRQQWRKEMIRDFDTLKSKELKRLDKVEDEAWQAYERSMSRSRRVRKRGGEGGHPKEKEMDVELTTQDRDGDAKWLDVILKCVSKRCEILGLDEPQRHQVDHSGTVGVMKTPETPDAEAWTEAAQQYYHSVERILQQPVSEN